MEYGQSMQPVIQNLKDAGCEKQCVEEFLALEQEGKRREQLKLLELHRQKLLDRVHEEERQIDCLDYLVYQMQKSSYRGGDYNLPEYLSWQLLAYAGGHV